MRGQAICRARTRSSIAGYFNGTASDLGLVRGGVLLATGETLVIRNADTAAPDRFPIGRMLHFAWDSGDQRVIDENPP